MSALGTVSSQPPSTGGAIPAWQEGLARQRAGDLAGASLIYRAILAREPGASMAKTLLGLALCQDEQFEEGLEQIRGAIAVADQAFSHFSLGEALASKQRLTEAVTAFRRSIELQPDVLAAHLGLGRALLGLADTAGAAAAFKAAVLLAPSDPEPYVGAAALLNQVGRPLDALGQLQVALGLAPDHAAAWAAVGRTMLELGRISDASAATRRALELDPALGMAHLTLGNILHAQHDDDAAVAAYGTAARLLPSLADVPCQMSNALYDLGRFDEAADAARGAAALQPGYADAHSNLGNALLRLLRYEEAEAAYRCALALQPDRAAFHSNLSVVLTAQARLSEALQAQARALALDPDFVDARYNHAITLLLDGQYEQGWRHYETRWKLAWSAPRGFVQPQWAGEDLNGRTILLHPEQGLGDTLQMVRYAPMVAARGGRVVLEVQAPLVRLMGCLPGVERVVPLGADLPPFDVHCPLFSLPLAFGTAVETVPSSPYLSADPGLTRLAQPLVGQKRGLRVGLVWSGAERIGPHVNRRRSVALRDLAPILRTLGMAFYSLQKDPAPDAARFAADHRVTDLMTEVADFADTAARIALLDLVIAVDTSTAHLAAAMGKPVWLLSRYNGCWRWLTRRTDSPWYPSLRIYRQEHPGDWRPTIARIAADLSECAVAWAGHRGDRIRDGEGAR